MLRSLLSALFFTVLFENTSSADPLTWLNPESRRIEAERQEIEKQLERLPAAPAPHATERVGFHSGYSASDQTVEWVELDLGQDEVLDAVVLIPAGSSGSGTKAGYGFPVRFRVELSEGSNQTGRSMLADYTGADFPNPGLLPVYLSTGGKHARFVRITATQLYRDGQRSLFALGEVMLLRGPLNLAGRLGRNDFTYSRTMGALPVWGLSNLIDGHSVLGPPEALQASPGFGYCSKPVDLAKDPRPELRWVQIDLGSVVPIEEVRLFPARPPNFVHRPGYGWPTELKVQFASQADFSDAHELAGFQDGSGIVPRFPVSPGDNAISYCAQKSQARFVRVSAPKLFDANGHFLFALAEMQVWSNHQNLALGKSVSAFDSEEGNGWSLAALVDGFTSSGKILDWPEWLIGLSQRRELTQQLALLDLRRSALKAKMRRLGWWLAGSGLAGTIIVLLGAHLRQDRARLREMEALRLRISQDLHDEIGSSLGSIAFISDDALALTDNAEMRRELGEIRETAHETLHSLRDLARLAQSGKYGQGDLSALLREIAERTLRGLTLVFNEEGAPAFNRLPMQQRRDLVLMYKEALHNLLRHAAATKVEITLAEAQGTLSLIIRDNGCGFDPDQVVVNGMGLTNLQRRATKHGGQVQINSSPGAGTTLIITLHA